MTQMQPMQDPCLQDFTTEEHNRTTWLPLPLSNKHIESSYSVLNTLKPLPPSQFETVAHLSPLPSPLPHFPPDQLHQKCTASDTARCREWKYRQESWGAQARARHSRALNFKSARKIKINKFLSQKEVESCHCAKTDQHHSPYESSH